VVERLMCLADSSLFAEDLRDLVLRIVGELPYAPAYAADLAANGGMYICLGMSEMDGEEARERGGLRIEKF
jgi:hypothetical protein